MVLVLCIGDLHIPHRATDVPVKFKTLLVPGKIHHILCPGNLCTRVSSFNKPTDSRKLSYLVGRDLTILSMQEVYDYLKTICTDMHITRGNFDEASAKYPEDEVCESHIVTLHHSSCELKCRTQCVLCRS